MDFFQAIITGIIQGLTEFLPVSSSGHIVLTSSIYKILTGQDFSTGSSEEIFFDIMLHLGTLMAVLVYFRTDLKHLFKEFFNAVNKKSFKEHPEALIPVYIVIGTIATVAVAFPFKDFFESLVYKPHFVGLVLIGTGSLLFFTEYISSKMLVKTKKITVLKSIAIGLAQGLAVTPGLSRSGATIAVGLAAGLDRTTCARYSFLLSIPIILAAALYQTLHLSFSQEILSYNWTAILTGTIVAAFVGYYCVKYFIKFISKNKLNVFAIYCWVLGAGMFVYFTLIS